MLLGRALAEGEGLRYSGVVGTPLAPKFPPLYPAVLALIWLASPDFPGNVAAFAVLNPVLLAGAAGLFGVWLRRGLGLPLATALSVTGLAWIGSALWRVALVPLSESLFLLALVAALWAGARMEADRRGRFVLLFLLAGGAAFYTRTIGVAVLVAGVVALLVRGRRRAAAAVASGSMAFLLPWALWSRHAATTLPPVLRDTLGPYGGWWFRQALEDPGGFLAFTAGNGVHLVGRMLALLLPGVVGSPLWLGLLLLPVLVVGLMETGRRTLLLPLTLALSLGVLLLWPFGEIRLVVPFHPLLVLGTVVGFRRLLVAPGVTGGGRVAVGVLALAWLGAYVGVSAVRLATGWAAEPYRVRAEALVHAARAVDEHVPAAGVVGAPELWSGIHLLTGRAVVPSAPFRPLGGDGPPWGTPVEQYELWAHTGVTHLLVEHGGRVHGEALDRLDAVCGPGAVRVLDRRPGQFLVALGWDGPCRARLLSGVGVEAASTHLPGESPAGHGSAGAPTRAPAPAR